MSSGEFAFQYYYDIQTALYSGDIAKLSEIFEGSPSSIELAAELLFMSWRNDEPISKTSVKFVFLAGSEIIDWKNRDWRVISAVAEFNEEAASMLRNSETRFLDVEEEMS